ncbi:Uncharacterized protein GBIM_20569, partial [Gryllus bimaculatus]
QGWRHGGHAVRGVGAQLGHRAPPSGRAAPRGQGPHRRQGARHAREGPGGHAAEAASGALLVEPRQGRNLLPGDLPNRFRRPVRELPALPLAARGRQEIQLHRQSPLMGVTFGVLIANWKLVRIGARTEAVGMLISLLFGFVFGLLVGAACNDMPWGGGVGDFPTGEMKGRGNFRSLWIGILWALPSGTGVALALLQGSAGPLIGVAISASLLPPIVNCIKEVAAPYVSPPELLRFWEHDIQRERQHNRSTLRLRSSRRSRRGPGQGPSPAHAFRRKVNDKRMQTQKTSNKSSTKRQVAIVKRKYVLLPEERKKRREKGRKRETFQPSLKLSS